MLIYLHGFNSSPASTKARLLQTRLEALGRGGEFACPALPDRPALAIELLEQEMARAPAASITLVGSSLGGYYATCLAEKLGVRAVLVNPAISRTSGCVPIWDRRRTSIPANSTSSPGSTSPSCRTCGSSVPRA